MVSVDGGGVSESSRVHSILEAGRCTGAECPSGNDLDHSLHCFDFRLRMVDIHAFRGFHWKDLGQCCFSVSFALIFVI